MKKVINYLVIFLLAIITLPVVTSAQQVADIDPNPQTNQCVQLKNNLRYQSRDSQTGGEVSMLQDFLQSKGHLNSEPTGYFGLLTLAAVKEFQAKFNIEPTGYVGIITRGTIQKLTNCSNTSSSNLIPITAVIPPTPVTPVTPLTSIPTVSTLVNAPTLTLLNPTFRYEHNIKNKLNIEWTSTNMSSSENIMDVRLRDLLNGREIQLLNDVKNSGKESVRLPKELASGKYTVELKTEVRIDNQWVTVFTQGPIFYIVNPDVPVPNSVVEPANNPTVINTVAPTTPTYSYSSTEDTYVDVSAKILSTNKDRAGTWGVFNRGSGGSYNVSEDWNWELKLKPKDDVKDGKIKKTVSWIAVEHEGSNQRWSTTDMWNWPLVIFYKDGQLNTSYTPLNFRLTGDTTFSLSGHIDNIYQSGTVIKVGYTDNTYSVAKIDGKAPTVKPGTGTTYNDTNNYSNAGFAITFPVENQTLKIGQRYKITWKGYYSGVDSYAVYLVGGALGSNGSVFLGTASANESGGSFTWSLQSSGSNAVSPGYGYRIQLSGKGASGGESPSFNISNSETTEVNTEATFITVTSPTFRNRIDVYNSRNMFVEWSIFNVQDSTPVTITLRDVATGKTYLVANGTAGDKMLKVTVPSDIPDDVREGKYVIDIQTSRPDRTFKVTGTSEQFIITSSKPRPYTTTTNTGLGDDIKYFITVKSPVNSREIWVPGSGDKEFSWDSSDLGDARIQIDLVDVTTKNIVHVVNGIKNDKVYKWSLPTSTPDGYYKAYIFATDTNGKVIAKAESVTFLIRK